MELSTIHGAKGREWKTVIPAAADDDQLPHRRTLEEAEPGGRADALEDERRLAYVAITRASDRFEAHVSASRQSRFLAEAGITTQPSAPAESRPALRADNAPKKVPKAFPAKYEGRCGACGRRFWVGDPIVRSAENWAHQTCG